MFNLPHQKLVLAIIPVKAKKSKILWFNISFFKREVKVLVGKTEAAVQAVLGKRCSENMQQIYRRTPMPKCGFNKAGEHPCRSVISIKSQSNVAKQLY